MIKGKKYFICGIPYQLAMKENLLMREQVMDEMSESDFDITAWSIEMECLFFGESEKAYFKFDDLNACRKLPNPIYPKPYYDMIKDKNFKYVEKKDNEIRLISCDIAGMGGKQNDASVYTIMGLIPKGKTYERIVYYMESMVGGHTMTQSIRIRQLFDDFDCDYLVLDTQSFGLGIFDMLATDLYDKERNVEYKAWTCINNKEMAERCMISDALPKIYSIKGNPTLNSDGAISLKDIFKREKIKLPVDEETGRQNLFKIKGFELLSIEKQVMLESVYKQTTALINEMVNLENKGEDALVKLKEPSGMRKDRYYSLCYANIIASQLEKELLRDKKEINFNEFMMIGANTFNGSNDWIESYY